MSAASRMSLLARLTYLPLVALAVANIALVLGFWRSFGATDPIIYQIIGASLALVEFTALVVISDAAARGEKAKALAWRFVLLLVLLVNLAADFGAIVTMTAADGERRERAIASYDAAVVAQREAGADIERLTLLLAAQHLDKPAAALDAEMRATLARRDAYIRAGLPVPRRVSDRAATAESAFRTAQVLEARIAERTAARARLEAFGARPQGAHAQFSSMAALLALADVRTSSEQVRVVLAALIAVVLKLVLVFGFWALTPRLKSERTGAAQESGAIEPRPRHAARPSRTSRAKKPADGIHHALDEFEREGE